MRVLLLVSFDTIQYLRECVFRVNINAIFINMQELDLKRCDTCHKKGRLFKTGGFFRWFLFVFLFQQEHFVCLVEIPSLDAVEINAAGHAVPEGVLAVPTHGIEAWGLLGVY